MSLSLLAMVATAPFVIALVVLCVREPMRVALPIFAALIPFGGGLAVGTSRFGSLSSLIGLLLGVGLALQLITTRRTAPRLSPTVPVWLLFLGSAGATTIWTVDRGQTISGVAVLGSLVLVYLFAAMSHVDRTILRRTENGLLVGGVAVVCYGLFQLVILGGFPDDTTGVGGEATTDGRFGNDLLGPGVQAVALLLPLVVALSRAFNRATRTGLVVNALIAALMLTGILMTGSRTGTLAAGVVMVVLVMSSPRPARKGMLASLGVGLALAAVVWIYNPAGVASRSFETASSSSGRTDIWQVGLHACADYCALGSGWSTFPDVYAETQASVPGARVLVGEGGSYQPHNLWLLAAVELGLPGLVLLAAGFGASLVEALRLPLARRGPPLSALAGTIFAVFFLSSMEFKFFWMVLILVVINRNLDLAETREAKQRGGPPSRPAQLGVDGVDR